MPDVSLLVSCAICIGGEESDGISVLPCGHCFHTNCISTFIRNERAVRPKPNTVACPTCRRPIKSASQVVRLFAPNAHLVPSSPVRPGTIRSSPPANLDDENENDTETLNALRRRVHKIAAENAQLKDALEAQRKEQDATFAARDLERRQSRSEIESLRQELSECHRKMQDGEMKVNKRLKELENMREAQAKEVIEISAEREKWEKDWTRITKENEHLVQDRDTYRRSCQTHREYAKRLKSERNSAQQQLKEAQEEHSRLNKQIKGLQDLMLSRNSSSSSSLPLHTSKKSETASASNFQSGHLSDDDDLLVTSPNCGDKSKGVVVISSSPGKESPSNQPTPTKTGKTPQKSQASSLTGISKFNIDESLGEDLVMPGDNAVSSSRNGHGGYRSSKRNKDPLDLLSKDGKPLALGELRRKRIRGDDKVFK